MALSLIQVRQWPPAELYHGPVISLALSWNYPFLFKLESFLKIKWKDLIFNQFSKAPGFRKLNLWRLSLNKTLPCIYCLTGSYQKPKGEMLWLAPRISWNSENNSEHYVPRKKGRAGKKEDSKASSTETKRSAFTLGRFPCSQKIIQISVALLLSGGQPTDGKFVNVSETTERIYTYCYHRWRTPGDHRHLKLYGKRVHDREGVPAWEKNGFLHCWWFTSSSVLLRSLPPSPIYTVHNYCASPCRQH